MVETTASTWNDYVIRYALSIGKISETTGITDRKLQVNKKYGIITSVKLQNTGNASTGTKKTLFLIKNAYTTIEQNISIVRYQSELMSSILHYIKHKQHKKRTFSHRAVAMQNSTYHNLYVYRLSY